VRPTDLRDGGVDRDPFPGPIPEGCVYSCYATREQVEAAELPPHRRFIVVRDLRDTLCSAYFSFRDTHRPNPAVEPIRVRLHQLDKEDGMVYLMDEFLPQCVAIHESWREEPVIHYEDLLDNDLEILKRVLLEECRLDVPEPKLERAIRSARFRRLTGRRRGDEAAEHLRKGVSGDWRNHFTDRVSAEFDQRFGAIA
jgi:lipopolysaccharide transport system ATP-binding protein